MPDNDQSPFAGIRDLFSELTRLNGEVMKHFTDHSSHASEHTGQSVLFDMLDSYREYWQTQGQHPGKLVDRQIALWQKQLGLWNRTMQRLAGENISPMVRTPKGDNRFRDEDWEANPIFSFLRESYLLNSEAALDCIDEADGIDEQTRQRLRFFTRQMLNAASPSNFIATNPEVLKLTRDSAGENLVRGARNLVDDLKRSADALNIRMTRLDAFELGKNIATTPGKVVFRNRLIELIQYQPATASVFRKPLLMVPPWINKFYIMDLRESNSFVRWAVEQGHTVFMVSWVNPGPEYRDTDIHDYLQDGLLAALDVIRDITGEPDANVVGYCAGGILLAIALAWLAAQGEQDRIASATHFATLFDFTDPGDIGAFIDEPIVRALEQQLEAQGIMDGRMMAVSFALLRENDLYWNYYVQNYLKGEEPAAFDLLYWNSDSTNLPAAVHRFFLRSLYIDNRLRQKNGIEVLGEKIDLGKVSTPAFILATVQDHIAKWRSSYAGTQLYSGPVRFVLGESGHIAGVMNPPGGKYGFFTGDEYPEDPDQWFATAERHDSSWWPYWAEWIGPFTGERIKPREPGSDEKYPPLAEAPGEYVRKRVAMI